MLKNFDFFWNKNILNSFRLVYTSSNCLANLQTLGIYILKKSHKLSIWLLCADLSLCINAACIRKMKQSLCSLCVREQNLNLHQSVYIILRCGDYQKWLLLSLWFFFLYRFCCCYFYIILWFSKKYLYNAIGWKAFKKNW